MGTPGDEDRDDAPEEREGEVTTGVPPLPPAQKAAACRNAFLLRAPKDMSQAVTACFPGLDDIRVNQAYQEVEEAGCGEGLDNLHTGQAPGTLYMASRPGLG